MSKAPSGRIDLEATLQPETELEKQLLYIPEFVMGLLWGTPRFGHPEGEIYRHVREVLDNIDRLSLDPADRRRLRLITFVHDTFKYKEDKSYPHDWSKHHGVYARRFLEGFTRDKAVLDIVELHDEAYYSWRLTHLYHRPVAGRNRLEKLLSRIGNHLQLYYLFFKCDTRTGDKNQAPLHWFERTIPGIEIIDF